MSEYARVTRTSGVQPPPSKERAIRLSVLKFARFIGLFAIARFLTRKRLRILCYHGFGDSDLHQFQPFLFMRRDTFARRMRCLARMRLPIISLQEGVSRFRAGRISHCEVVITIDDGWKSTLTDAIPILVELKFPACVYIATYYSDKQTDVFNVVIWYMLWKTNLQQVSLIDVHPALDGDYHLGADSERVGRHWISAAESHCGYVERQQLLHRLATALQLDVGDVFRNDRFKLLNRQEIMKLKEFCVDVQLHTHRHYLPETRSEALAKEIADNRRLLESWTSKACTHFCYPSGVYTRDQPVWLAAHGIESATTCDVGLNDASVSPLLLKRYLDREDWDDIEFEAAMSGFLDLAHRIVRG